jgi:WhiB family redox-sensing transcriptional regulator
MTARPLPDGLPPLSIRDLTNLINRDNPACAARPELFFGPDGHEPPAEHAERVTAARGLCASCPVRLACLAYALKTSPENGVWAGHDADAGELAYLARAAGRPGKPEAERRPVRQPAA